MGHASDCAVNDGPAFLPGPCSCGSDVGPLDPVESFIPIVLVGAWRGRLAIRERNAETFIETQQSKILGGRGVRLRLDLIDPHRWPIFPRGADHLDLNSAALPVILKGQANALLSGFNRKGLVATGLAKILRFFRRWILGQLSPGTRKFPHDDCPLR